MEKIKVSSDTLYKYLLEHNFVISVLSDSMGVSYAIVSGCFRHSQNRYGNPIKFSSANIKKMNDAIMQIASEMRNSLVVFGTKQMFTNQHGTTYDPGLIEPIKQGVGKFFKLRGLTEKVLGWNVAKCGMTFSSPSSKIYGNISREDVNRINAELLAVAGVLSSYEVVAEEDLISGASDMIEQPEIAPSVVEEKPIFMASPAYNRVPVEDTNYTLDDLCETIAEEKPSSAVRLRDVLVKQGIKSLPILLSLTTGQLLDIEGMGSGMLGQIHKALKKMGVRW